MMSQRIEEIETLSLNVTMESYIYLSQVNDGTEDCAEGEDEATFDEDGDETSAFDCEYSGECIHFHTSTMVGRLY